ncbi:hypothetical protein GGR56DRAFT_160185 [Xylariaceae sp. FL0804]|nr:hypothetical protein GGR56DRAFT_160185 [Xylariaceae sp. FL0804]
MFILPQRFQQVYGMSGISAGIRLLPFYLAVPIAKLFSATVAGKMKIPLMYILITGACTQVIGFALLSTLPLTSGIPHRLYGYEVVAGWGCGMNFSLLTSAIPLVIESRDQAVGVGASAQFRFMGSAIVLSISTSVFNSYVKPQLGAILGIKQADLNDLGNVVSMSTEAVREDVRQALVEGYNRQTLVLCIASALQVPATMLLWSRKKKQQLLT